MSNQATWPCTWLVEKRVATEDGPLVDVVECGAPAREESYDGGHVGWRCDAGHRHVPIEVAWQPGGIAWQLEQDEPW